MREFVASLMAGVGWWGVFVWLTAQPDPVTDPLYRLGRYANRADINWWEGTAFMYVPLSGWTCALPPGPPSAPGVWRMADPKAVAGADIYCEYSPGINAAIYANRRPDVGYRYALAVRESEWDVWSAEASPGEPPATLQTPHDLKIWPPEE